MESFSNNALSQNCNSGLVDALNNYVGAVLESRNRTPSDHTYATIDSPAPSVVPVRLTGINDEG